MAESWNNWSGGLACQPAVIERPSDEEGLAAVVRRAASDGRRLRPVGSGHSSAPLVPSDDVLVSLAGLAGVVEVDRSAGEATLLAGTTLESAGADLLREGVAIENLGDVDTQAIAGAMSTGTHGSGRDFPHLGAYIQGFRMVTADGAIVEFDGDDQDVLRAARLGLGLLGVLSSVRIRVIPSGDYVRREWCAGTDDCLRSFDALVDGNRNMDFYWYPRRDDVEIRTHNATAADPGPTIPGERLQEERGSLDALLTSKRTLKFHEMEYWLPYEDGIACFEEIRHQVKAGHRDEVAWRVLVRVVAADDAFLSPAFERRSVTISIHQNVSMPYQEFFDSIEPIFWRFGGRPHWAKTHSLGHDQLRRLYPAWETFTAIRRRFDPAGRLLNPYLRELFEPAA